jgi:GNAT superfamily N-acetyltransferase
VVSGVRGVGPRDVDRVVALWSALMGHHEALDPQWRAAPGAEDERRRLLARLLADPEAAVLVWDEGGDLLGFCAAQIETAPPLVAERARAEITDLFVREDSRRRGIGRRLVEATTDWIGERGVRRVEVRVAVRNAEGQAFWRALGYADLVNLLQRSL